MDAERTAYRTPPRWLRGWRLFVTITVTAALLVVLSLVTFVMLSGNLRSVIEQARRDGLPTTWAELKRPVNPRHAVLHAQIEALAQANRAYGYANVYIDKKQYRLGTPGTPLTEGFVAQVAKRSPATRKTIADLLDHLREPLRPWADPSPVQWSKMWQQAQLFTLANEDLLGRADASEADVLRVLVACRSFGPDSLVHVTQRAQVLSQVCWAIRYRLPQLAGRSPELAAALRAEAKTLDGLLHEAAPAEFVRSIRILEADPRRIAIDMSRSLPGMLENPVMLALFHRLGRVGALDDRRLWALAAAASTDPRGPTPGAHSLPRHWSRLSDWVVMSFLLDHSIWTWYRLLPRTKMDLLATAAALDGAPWPVDPYSPTGDPLREVRDADGRVIVVYGLGPDGDDDGGKSGDDAIVLYAPIDLPVIPPPAMTPELEEEE